MTNSAENLVPPPDNRIIVPTELLEFDYFALLSRCKEADYNEVQMGRASSNPFRASLTFGANPCFAGATYTKSGDGIYVFHSVATIFPSELEVLLQSGKVYGGIVGGSPASYTKTENLKLLTQFGIKFIPPPEDDFQASFAVAASPDEKKVYYAYNSRLYRLSRNI
jgi:hypothetical protein